MATSKQRTDAAVMINTIYSVFTWKFTTQLLVREHKLEQERLIILFPAARVLPGHTRVSPVDGALGVVHNRHSRALVVALAVERLRTTPVSGEGV